VSLREKSAPLNRIPATDVTQILNTNLHNSHSHCDVIQKTLAACSSHWIADACNGTNLPQTANNYLAPLQGCGGAGAGGLDSAADGGCGVVCCVVGGVTQ